MAEHIVLSLKEYKDKIDGIMSSLDKLEEGTTKYNNLLKNTVGDIDSNVKLLADQKRQLEALKDAYKSGSISMEDYLKGERELKIAIQDNNRIINIQQKLQNDTKGSYRDLSDTLSLLKNSYKQLTEAEKESTGGKDLLKDIQTLDEYLKMTDKDFGEFHRNVGNYASGFKDVSDAFRQLGINIGGLGPAFNLATVAGNGFNGILNTLKAHPFIAILGILVATFMKLKDAIGQNEELSKKWSVAMSAFQPIINAIKNAIDWLAEGFVNVMAWVTDNLPKGLKMFGNFAKGVTNVAGTILNIMLYIPRQIVKAFTWMDKQLISGIKWIVDGIADLLDMVGLDIGKSMKDWSEKIANTATSAMDGLNDALANAGKYVKDLGDSIDNTMNKWARATENQMNLTRKQTKLDEDRRKQEIATEESLLRQQDLRNKIAESSGEEKKKLLQQLKNEIEQTGRKELDIAKRTLELEKQRRELAPNSREDNLRYEELQKSVIRVESATSAATVRINKQITSTTETLSKAAQKAASDAEREANKASTEIVKSVKLATEEIKANTEQRLSELDSEFKVELELGKKTYAELQDFENERYRLTMVGLSKQKAAIQEALQNQKLLANDRLALEIAYQKLVIADINEETKHKINSNKLWLDDRKKTLEEAQSIEKKVNQDRTSNIDVRFTTSFVDISQQYVEGKLNFEEYQKELSRIQREEEDKRLQEQVRTTGVALKQYEQYMNDVYDKFGEGSDEFKAALEKYNDALAANDQAVNDHKIFTAQQQVEETKTTKDNINKQINTYNALAKGIGSVMGKVADIMEENIRKKVENGEISEEEAEKEFERVKKIQIAEAVISTLSGAVGAFMGTWKDETIQPIYVRAALAGVNTASVLAAGIAQIQQIKNTKFGSSDSGDISGGANVGGVSVLPLLNEQADMNTLQQVQTNSMLDNEDKETRVYILESDIYDSQNRVEVRRKSTTF